MCPDIVEFAIFGCGLRIPLEMLIKHRTPDIIKERQQVRMDSNWELRSMRVKSNVSSHGRSRSTATKPGAVLLDESEQSAIVEKVNNLSKEAADLRSKISGLEMQYERQTITAKQHDKLVKKYLVELFDINRELLPLKERIDKDAEERERMKVREKLEAMGVKRGKTRSTKKQGAARKAKVAKSRRKRAAS